MEVNQDVLLRALVKLVAALKADRIACVQLSNDVAALRNALQEMSGDRFLSLVERHRNELEAKTRHIMASDVASLDELIPLIVQALPDSDL